MGSDVLAHGLLLGYVTVFVGGILTSLTPCVLPLIPITVALFGAKGASRPRAMALATLYVLGIGVMYSALGVFSALAGKAFGTYMANPWVMVPIAILFLVMAASMFGAFDMNLPPSLQARLSSMGGKGYGGAFIMGLVGGLIAAPCTGPVLASILAFVATTRSVVLGASLLFVYALGMGLLFFLVAAFAVALPKSGAWMESVKSFFGVVMTLAALYFLRNVIPPLAHLGRHTTPFLTVSVGLVAAGLAAGAITLSFHDERAKQVRKGIAVLATVVGAFGALSYVLTPKPVEGGQELVWLHGDDTVLAAAKAKHTPALLDFYADWCLPCKELELKTFSDPKVAEALGRFTLGKVDCTTDDDPKVTATKERYGADTLPTLVLLQTDGNVAKRVNHVVSPAELLELLDQVK